MKKMCIRDRRKYMNKFDEIQALLGLTDKERAQILSINMANNPSRKYKEVWIGLGGTQSAVYATEVSLEEYICCLLYTSYSPYLLAELNYRYRRLVRTNFMDFAYFCRHGTTR